MKNRKFDIAKDLGKILKEKEAEETNPPSVENPLGDIILEKDYKGYMDPCQIAMIIPKTKSIDDVLKSFFEASGLDNLPLVDYAGSDGKTNRVLIPSEYLKTVCELCKHSSYVEIYLKRDKPVCFQTEDMIYLIAPRVESDPKPDRNPILSKEGRENESKELFNNAIVTYSKK